MIRELAGFILETWRWLFWSVLTAMAIMLPVVALVLGAWGIYSWIR